MLKERDPNYQLNFEQYAARNNEQNGKKVYRRIESTFEHERVISMLIEN